MEHKCAPIVDDRMSGIRSALIAHDDIRFTSQDVNDFTFAFIPPLRADDHEIRHVPTSLSKYSYKKRALTKMSQSQTSFILGRPCRLCQAHQSRGAKGKIRDSWKREI